MCSASTVRSDSDRLIAEWFSRLAVCGDEHPFGVPLVAPLLQGDTCGLQVVALASQACATQDYGETALRQALFGVGQPSSQFLPAALFLITLPFGRVSSLLLLSLTDRQSEAAIQLGQFLTIPILQVLKVEQLSFPHVIGSAGNGSRPAGRTMWSQRAFAFGASQVLRSHSEATPGCQVGTQQAA